METTFTCLRCVRALSGQNTPRQSSKIAQIASGARKLSSKSQQPPASRSILTKVEKDVFRERPRQASTAAVIVEQPDNFERHFQYPEYGDYRPSNRLSQDNLFHPFSQSSTPRIMPTVRIQCTDKHGSQPRPTTLRRRS